jgi:hypothetical protein
MPMRLNKLVLCQQTIEEEEKEEQGGGGNDPQNPKDPK